MQPLPTILPGHRREQAAGGGPPRDGCLEAPPRGKKKLKLIESMYDLSELGPCEAREALAKKVLPPAPDGKPPAKRAVHPADDKVAEWMRNERKRAEERSEQKWRHKFEEWQQNEFQNALAKVRIGRRDEASKGPGKPGPKQRSSSAAQLPSQEDAEGNEEASQQQNATLSSEELLGMQERAEAAEQECASIREERDGLQSELNDSKEEVSRLGKDVNRLEEELSASQGRLLTERERTAHLERLLLEARAERDAWAQRAEREQERLRKAAQERRALAERVTDLGHVVEQLNTRASDALEGVGSGQASPLHLDDGARREERQRMRQMEREEEEAAIRIQSRIRGRTSRRGLHSSSSKESSKESSVVTQAIPPEEEEGQMPEGEDEESEADRGRKARRETAANRPTRTPKASDADALLRHESEAEANAEAEEAEDPELESAAVRIQSLHRGRKAREDSSKRLEARAQKAKSRELAEPTVEESQEPQDLVGDMDFDVLRDQMRDSLVHASMTGALGDSLAKLDAEVAPESMDFDVMRDQMRDSLVHASITGALGDSLAKLEAEDAPESPTMSQEERERQEEEQGALLRQETELEESRMKAEEDFDVREEARDEASDSEDSDAEELEKAKSAAQEALKEALFKRGAPAEASASPTSAAPGQEASASTGVDGDVPVSPAAGGDNYISPERAPAAGSGDEEPAGADGNNYISPERAAAGGGDKEKPSPGTVLRQNGELKEENMALRDELSSMLKSETCSPGTTEEQISPERSVPVEMLLPANVQAQAGSPTMAQAGLFLPVPLEPTVQAQNASSPLGSNHSESQRSNRQDAASS